MNCVNDHYNRDYVKRKREEEEIHREELRFPGVADPSATKRPIDELRSPVVNRYQDAYRVGAGLVGLGTIIKVVGLVLAGIIVVGSLSISALTEVGIVLAAIVGGLFWVFGVIVAAQGQVLQAPLDNAVASSRFLTDTERADAMGLPRSVADRSGD
ncbi:MAG: hypothetical protein AABO57_05955 [Acidobacteriota bacterium]